MERNKLGRIHDWIVRILLILMFVACGIGLWFIFVGCEDGNPILTKQCKCKVIGENNDTSVVRLKKDYKDQKINIFTPCGKMNKIVADELEVNTVSCESYSEK
jgi:hypothetical protein